MASGDAGALGTLGELAARRVIVSPAGFGQNERSMGEPLDGHGAVEPAWIGAGVDDLELGYLAIHG